MQQGEPLAKTDPSQTLAEHACEVWGAAKAMLNALQHALPPEVAEMLKQAVYVHDVGKAAKGFQSMLRTGGKWKHRHELLSGAVALALGLPDEVVLAVLTHHVSLDHGSLASAGHKLTEEVWSQHGKRQWHKLLHELRDYWQWLQKWLAELGFEVSALRQPEELPELRGLVRRYSREKVRQSDKRHTLLFLRGLLLAADHLASGHHTAPACLTAPRWHISQWHLFQDRMAHICGDVILQAPTGSGKTEAAILWALANRRGEERIFYVLPTHASINAMVQRLRRVFDDEMVAPLHARVLHQEFASHFDGCYNTAADTAKRRSDLYRQFYAPIKVLTPFQIIKPF